VQDASLSCRACLWLIFLRDGASRHCNEQRATYKQQTGFHFDAPRNPARHPTAFRERLATFLYVLRRYLTEPDKREMNQAINPLCITVIGRARPISQEICFAWASTPPLKTLRK
jgi:hypothetical protein